MMLFGYGVSRFVWGLAATLAGTAALAQSPPETPQPAAAQPAGSAGADRSFPQPVRVADLKERLVLEPSNHQGALGRVDDVARRADGALAIVVRYGGFLGFGRRKIAVPVETVALLGPFVQIVGLDQQQLDALPTWTGEGGTAVPPDERIRVGLGRN